MITLVSGTFDVSNFGDLLFPLILSNKLSDITELKFVSPIGNSLPISDSITSRNITDFLMNNDGIDALIVGGGNIIHSKPTHLSAYYSANCIHAYPELWLSPTLYLPETVPIIWNAPGVPESFISEHHKIVKKALQRVNYLSVRDTYSRNLLHEISPSIPVFVVPDTAWIINEIWSKSHLKQTYLNFATRHELDYNNPFFIIHANSRYLNGIQPSEVAHQIDKISCSLFLQPVIISMGACHGDDVLSHQIANHMKTKPIVIDKINSLKEITACLSHAEFYIGSSMHGLIVSSAYGVPSIGVASKSKIKFQGLSDFMCFENLIVDSWEIAAGIVLDMNLISRHKHLVKISKKAGSLLHKHWKDIRSILNKSKSYPNEDNLFKPSLPSIIDYQSILINTYVKYEAQQSKLINIENQLKDETISKLKIDGKRKDEKIMHLTTDAKLKDKKISILHNESCLKDKKIALLKK
jgi:polysaccharide pyruvyl transferase WcaK-like protein